MIQELVESGVTRALIVRSPYVELILSGLKTWEMRSAPTKVRGRVALIRGGSGLIVGTVRIDGSLPALEECAFGPTSCYHHVDDLSLLRKWRFPWLLGDPLKFADPILYRHPPGAVIWVDLKTLV